MKTGKENKSESQDQGVEWRAAGEQKQKETDEYGIVGHVAHDKRKSFRVLLGPERAQARTKAGGT